MPLGELAQAALSGVLLGLVYTAISAGLSLTLGVMRVVNVAHSTFVLLGSFFALELFRSAGIGPIFAALLSMPPFFIMGALMQKFLIGRVAREPQTLGLLVLFGVLVALESLSILVWSTDTRVLALDYRNASLSLGPLSLPLRRVVAGAMALIAVGILHLFLQRTSPGKGIRAMAENRDAAAVLGVDVRRLSMVVFGIGTATAAIGGIALAMVFPFAPQDHIRWLAWAFLVVIIGGLGSVRNTLVAGLLVGLLESFSGVLLPFRYVYLVVYSALALALLVRSQGLMGTRARSL